MAIWTGHGLLPRSRAPGLPRDIPLCLQSPANAASFPRAPRRSVRSASAAPASSIARPFVQRHRRGPCRKRKRREALNLEAAMAGAVEELCKEASCSICLDYFRDPVILPDCGHNFCRACLTRSWREPGAEPSCPQCRRKAQKRKLRPNRQLASIVEIAKRFALQEERESGARGKACGKHREPLRLFCKEDEAPLCMFCIISKEHKDHELVPLEDAPQGTKDQFYNRLEMLKNERERILTYKGNIEKESQDLLKQTEEEKQETVAKFRQLHAFLEKQEKHLLAQMEEVEKEVAKKRDQHLAEFSEALSTLESLIQEMEEKSQQLAGELLQDVQSTLQRYEEKETFLKPVTFPQALKWKIWDFCDINHLLEGVMKQLKDTLDSGLHQQKAKVILDPDTAHPELILSEDQKSVRDGKKAQTLHNNPERFDRFGAVLGHEGFTAGRHFWDVLVGSEEEWRVGVARKSVRRKGLFSFRPEEGIWAVGKWWGSYKASEKDRYAPLTLSGELKRIRVCLNYAGGRVAFFDVDRAALLYEFSGASFSGEILLPFFRVLSKGHLRISS